MASSRLSDIRREYLRAGLTPEMLDESPVTQFRHWLDEVIREGASEEPTAMTLATVSADGVPAARTVLLKGLDDGFVFYTNYESDKALALAANPVCALLFFWPALERQVRVTGRAERTTPEESDEYFASRPRESQLGAWASDQSRQIASRDVLEARLAELTAKFPGDIERPAFWGGFRVRPTRFEFWQGRKSRLHDRLVYEPIESSAGGFRIVRVAP